jgi:RNA polymerase sigma-70 factor (ECF subfamily)
MSLACLQQKHKTAPAAAATLCGAPACDWAALYRSHRAAVYSQCRRLLGDRHAAEDATQETFARAFRYLVAVEDAQHQRRWLLRVANNYCLNLIRDRKRRAELLVRMNVDDASDGPEAFAETFMDREVAVCVARSLPDKVRRVAWLMYVDEMRQEQVAQTLGISRRTVVNRLAAFRAGVRRALVRILETPAL